MNLNFGKFDIFLGLLPMEKEEALLQRERSKSNHQQISTNKVSKYQQRHDRTFVTSKCIRAIKNIIGLELISFMPSFDANRICDFLGNHQIIR